MDETPGNACYCGHSEIQFPAGPFLCSWNGRLKGSSLGLPAGLFFFWPLLFLLESNIFSKKFIKTTLSNESMAKNIFNFSDYDAAKSAREEQQQELAESRLELLINQHPAIKSIRKEAQRVGNKAKKVTEITLYGRSLNPARILNYISAEEEKNIKELKRSIEPEFTAKAQRDIQVQIIKENIEDLTVSGVRISQRNNGYLNPEDKKELYGRLVAELKQLSDNGRNRYFQQQFPEIREIAGYVAPFSDESISTLRLMLKRLAQQKHIHHKNAETLLNLLTSTEKVLPPSRTTAAIPSSKTGPAEAVAVEQRSPYAQELADNITQFQEELEGLVGKHYAATLIPKINLSAYNQEGMLNAYLRTVRRIQEEIQRNPHQLTERYGPTPKNVERYASLDAVLQLKAELFQHTKGEQNVAATNGAEFDLENYKSKLLAKAGLEEEVARAYTEGKNGKIIGQNNYMPRRHFKSNAKRKAPPDKFHQQGDAVFDELVKMGAIVCKSRGRDLYSLNPHLDTIKNSFLREYMRVTVHYEKILKQEGSITPLINI